MVDLQVNDPVHVAAATAAATPGSSNTSPLEGVVWFIGSVPGFLGAAGKDVGGNDGGGVVVGVRLTGASVGLAPPGGGDSSSGGIYQGIKYFDCPPKSGVFCLPNAVTKRHLTRLEELRLRRELSSSTSTTSTAAAPTTAAGTTSAAAALLSTPPRIKTTSSITGLKPASPVVSTSVVPSSPGGRPTTAAAPASTPPSSGSAAAATRSKLDELRARRAALQRKDDATDTTSATTATTTTTAAPRSAAVTAAAPVGASSSPPPATSSGDRTNVRIIEELRLQLSERTNQMNDLKTALERSQQQAQQALTKIAQLEKDAATVAATKATGTNRSSNTVDVSHNQGEVAQQLQQEKQAHAETQRRLKEVEEQANTNAAAAAQASPSSSSQQQQPQQQWSSAQASEAYKERARLQAEIAALHRASAAWDAERVELESTIEDVTLDKEQLQEEKENLEDKLEECKLDVETAQMECEELRLQVEDVRRHYAEQQQQQHASLATTAQTTSSGDEDNQGGGQQQETTANNDAAEEKIRALSVQNGRLREALIRLREQTALEKMQMHKDLRTAEKEMEAAKAIQAESVQLKQIKLTLEEQVNDLKDMVEQGAAFEGMVEDLSDRVMGMEEVIMTLQGTIREMEEAAELTAEMEEVQTEEIKALYRDMEGRDSIIRNMEEAIKMQRRREDDYRRTVGNYRTTVETLRQERQALLELQQGEHGEKTTWMAASQKALARAAQLVTDAAALRKREARAAMVSMESQVYKHLSVRLERLLPKPPNVSREISAVKGELVTSKVAGKASKTLEGIAESFGKNIKPPLPPSPEADPTKTRAASTDEGNVVEAEAVSRPVWELSDELKQEVTTMLHQTEFSHVLIDASAELRRLLAAGQWPDLLTPGVSLELGSILGHGIGQLDSMLTVILKSLKEEGTLTQEQSNIGALRQTIQTTMQAIRVDIEREDSTLVPASWNPAGWQLLKDASIARFSCMGSTAALSLALHANERGSAQPPARLFTLYGKLEQTSTQATNVCLRLANLDVQNTQLVNNLSACMVQWKMEASKVMECVHKLILSSTPSSAENVEACEQAVAKTLKALAVLSHSLRGAGLNPTEDEKVHALSPEADDAWEQLTDIVRSIRGIDGDEEDVNYLIRAHDIEIELQQAVANQPKLVQAEAKLATLEKILSSRSKEIAMQNAKMSELEKHLAKSSTGALGRSHTSDHKSVEEYNSLKEENRVLIEAIDVMSRQVDEYENEIRVLKDFKSPKRGAGGGRTPRRSVTSIGAMGDLGSPTHNRGGGAVDEATLATVGALEATLFRPALQAALRDVARWKSEATAQAIMHLPPLPSAEELKLDDRDADDLMQLESALSFYRLEKASTQLIDLNHPTKSPREQLRELKARDRMASENLESVFLRCRGRLYG